MNVQANIGHNNPPDPIDAVTAPYADEISEAEKWLDGSKVETEDQMEAVDALLKAIRSCGTDLSKAQKSATGPLHDRWKAEIARWKPTVDDVGRIKKGLAALVDDFKQKLAAEREFARRAAWEAAELARLEAERAAATANPANIEEAREAEARAIEAQKAQVAAQAAQKDTVKGLRAFTETVVVDPAALALWIWKNDREALVEFQAERARKLALDIPGVVEQRKTKRAY